MLKYVTLLIFLRTKVRNLAINFFYFIINTMIRLYEKIFSIIFTFIFLGANLLFSQPNNAGQNDKFNNPNSKSKKFEGKINFVQEFLEDTLSYTYLVKDKIVRLDAQENCKNCKNKDNYMIFNLDKGTITAVDPVHKMYINIPPKPYSKNDDKNFQIIKTNNSKKIQGYKCFQWRVKNKLQNTEVSYWVAQDNFAFFEDFLKLWNRTEKHAEYYLRIPDTDGFFPMLSEERTTLREQKMALRVTQVTKQPLDPSIFEIPKEFQSYDH